MIPTDPYQYLREHIGCKYSIAENGKHKRQWSKGELLKESDLWNYEINCCGELPNEITLESDYKGEEEYKNKENQDHAESILQKYGVGYYISSHNGKSDYIRFRFKTSGEITPKLRLAIIRYLAKEGLEFDELFYSLKFVRPVPNRTHWKHSDYIEKVIKVVEGGELDVDALGIKPIKKPTIARSGSMPSEPVGWALSINIRKMAERYRRVDCPTCHTSYKFNELLGWYECTECKERGGITKFAQMVQEISQ